MFLIVFILFIGCETVYTKSIPTISEQFSLNTIEIDDTNNGTVSVRQTMYMDQTNRRSHMIADGDLCQGHLEEINRCDAGWKSGWQITIGGPVGTNVSDWSCTNHTLNPDPKDCVFSPFFAFPSNYTYIGIQNITQHSGTVVEVDAWMWWETSPGASFSEKWQFYTLVNTAIPARIAKIYTPKVGFHLWHIDFLNFVSGAPALSLFNAPKGNTCPPATPGVAMARVNLNGIVLFTSNTDTTDSTESTTVTVYNKTAINIRTVGQRLLSELDASKGIYHTNSTVWATETSSFHIFATNATEFCHYHPRDTVSTTIQGTGQFHVTYSAPIRIAANDQFIIPKESAHAFGPIKGGGPVVVSVMWSPPAGYFEGNVWNWYDNVTIPTSGCVDI